MGGGAGDVELGLELLAPLADQRRRHQHQHVLDHSAQQVFLEHHAGLDGLAEPDFVGQQHPAAELLEHLAHRLDLVPEGLDVAQVGQAQQLVEALRQAEVSEALAQLVPICVILGPALHGGAQERKIELDRERNIDLDPRQSGRRGRLLRRRSWRGGMRARERPGERRPLGWRRCARARDHALSGGRPASLHDAAQPAEQPFASRPPARNARRASGAEVGPWRSSNACAAVNLFCCASASAWSR